MSIKQRYRGYPYQAKHTWEQGDPTAMFASKTSFTQWAEVGVPSQTTRFLPIKLVYKELCRVKLSISSKLRPWRTGRNLLLVHGTNGILYTKMLHICTKALTNILYICFISLIPYIKINFSWAQWFTSNKLCFEVLNICYYFLQTIKDFTSLEIHINKPYWATWHYLELY